jgi:hypothetical protein
MPDNPSSIDDLTIDVTPIGKDGSAAVTEQLGVKGSLLLRCGLAKESAELLQKAQKMSKSVECSLLLAIAYADLSDLDKAKENFEAVRPQLDALNRDQASGNGIVWQLYRYLELLRKEIEERLMAGAE